MKLNGKRKGKNCENNICGSFETEVFRTLKTFSYGPEIHKSSNSNAKTMNVAVKQSEQHIDMLDYCRPT